MKTIVWQEPWDGVDADGKDAVCNVELRATAEDCIKIQRHAVRNRLSSDELLDFFALNHGAWEIDQRKEQ